MANVRPSRRNGRMLLQQFRFCRYGILLAVAACVTAGAAAEEPPAAVGGAEAATPNADTKEVTAPKQEATPNDLQTKSKDEAVAAAKAQAMEALTKVSKEVEGLKTQLKTCGSSKATLEDSLKIAKGDAESLRKDKASAESQLSTCNTAKVSSDKEAAKQHSITEQLKSDKTELEGQVVAAMTEIEEKKKAIRQKDEENSRQSKDISKLQKKVSDLGIEVSTKSDEVLTLKSDNANYKGKLNSKELELTSLAEEKQSLQQQFTSLQNELAGLQKSHSNLTQQHESLSNMYADPSLEHFLRAKAIKVYDHPGVKGAKEKTFRYVLPSLEAGRLRGLHWFNTSEAKLFDRLNAYVGGEKVEPWYPVLHGFLVYGLFGVPFLCSIWCLFSIMCRIRACLLFGHLYFALTFACAAGFAGIAGVDPLTAFAMHDAAVFVFAQSAFGVVFFMYLGLLVLLSAVAWFSTNREKCIRSVQLVAVGPIAAAYYVLVWTPAMMDMMPKVNEEIMAHAEGQLASWVWLPYLVVTILFFILLRLEQLSWRLPGSTKDESDKLSIKMRDGDLRAEELVSLVGNTSTFDARDIELGKRS